MPDRPASSSRRSAVLRCLLLALAGATVWAPARAEPVDLELVLAIDVSQSVDLAEGKLQRQGYVQALGDPRIIAAIRRGALGRIAVTYFEWGGPGLWRRVVDWRVIDGADSARDFAGLLSRTPISRLPGTSISGAIEVGMELLATNRFEGTRRVIDVSGDGPNNGGTNVAVARDRAVAAGIAINGVAINSLEPDGFSLPDLDLYYEECVIGGPGAFVEAVAGFDSFADAILKKLILEIADARPRASDPVTPATFDLAPAFDLAQARPAPRGRGKYAPACDIGERLRFFDNPGAPILIPPLRR